jgi:hypothetical protein
MTGHLDPINDDVNNLNKLIRTFCKNNNKLLFDFADIESCNPDGTCFLDQGASYNCDYSNGLNNWAGEWITAHPDSELAQLTSKCEVCDHSPDDQDGPNTTPLARLNCILKGRAFWWMIAAAAGWTPGQPTSSTTTSSGGGGGGGGTHTTTAAATTSTAVTSTSTILPATTTTIQPPQECASDADCDDGLFCNGSERCDNSICVTGDNPCNAGKLCREDMDTCWDIVILNASCMQESVRRPALRSTRCPWLLVNCADDNHFNAIHSAITIEGPSENAQGVEVDGGRNSFKMGNIIFIPVCLGKDASVGQWKIKIKTENGTIETPFEETIEAHFLVQ